MRRDWQAEGRESGPKAGCLWFAQTGHNVCDQAAGLGFRTYWESHRLQDRRLDAYGQSLALFGLPLTASRTETNAAGDTVVTQWFERGRFEWHPGNPTAYKVLLGLLGREVSNGPDVGVITYRHPSAQWSVEYPSDLLHPEDLGNGVTVFISQDRGIVAAVDSYVAEGDAYGNTGEDLRNRARGTLARIYGRPVDEENIVTAPGGRWATGITFTTERGSKGEALYEQRGRAQGSYRVNGFLFGYKADVEESILPRFMAMRFTFRSEAPGTTDLDRARESLALYFTYLNAGRYGEAVAYYGGDYEVLQGWNPYIAPNDHAALFESACRGLISCYKLRRIASEGAVSATEWRFMVEFSNPDGTLFKLGPCCGSTEEEMPTRTQFEYTVKKVNNRFLVMGIPVYVP